MTYEPIVIGVLGALAWGITIGAIKNVVKMALREMIKPEFLEESCRKDAGKGGGR